MDEREDALEQAERAGQGPAFLERLATLVGGRAQARAAFGEPVRQGDVTVIPVARVAWGFGGGGGRSGPSEGGPSEGGPGRPGGSGEGGGGGGGAKPVGYIVVTNEGATFHEIRDAGARWPTILAGGLAAWFTLRGVRGLLRR